MMNGIKVLIVGGSGFLGKNLCRYLLLQGADVRVLDALVRIEDFSQNISSEIDWIEGDYGLAGTITKALKNIDIVFHLASTTIPNTSNKDPAFDLRSNVLPTIQMLDIANKMEVKKVIFFSSGGTVYGVPKELPISEDHLLNPICSYGIHKNAIEQYLGLFYKMYGLDYAIARISNPYGAWQRPNLGQGVIANFIDKIRNKEPIEIWGNGKTVRDYIHVDDLMAGVISLITYAGKYKLFNIGSGKGASLIEVSEIIGNIFSCEPDIQFLEGRAVDIEKNILSIKRAMSELGWSPKIDLPSGIKNTIEEQFLS
jgi:UDP-glucose 4-epimerase